MNSAPRDRNPARSHLATSWRSIATTDTRINDVAFVAENWNRTPQGTEPHEIRPGDRIGQMVFMPVGLPVFNEVDEFDSETARGEGGFGSTGLTA
ncbi:hypothetical protein [Salipiger mucosus]|uniref:hypothetical protein n=1 Tax=Salipiger mucosus TaxID=263378 RepID=UPI0012EB65A0|nr:hypothetical protein [Salipiger mucosus]